MPCCFAFLNCLAAQACFMWASLLKCVIASYDHCMGGWLLDFTQQIWIMLKWAANWRGYANMSQMAAWGADSGDMQTVYGGGSVWQVHHSVIKGHIITYNKACMTIARGKKMQSLRELPVVSFSSSSLLFSFFCFRFPCKSVLSCWYGRTLCYALCVGGLGYIYYVQTSIRPAITS